jgi:hypothetical protein
MSRLSNQELHPFSSHDPRRKQIFGETSLRVALYFFARDFGWWTQTLRLEIRSFLCRIQILRDKRWAQPAIDLGPLYEPTLSGHLLLSAETQHRTSSIQSLFAKYPWASGSDAMLVLEGWDMGKQFAACSEGNNNMETETPSGLFSE